MSRWPRIIVPGQALHILQRGNNRQACFFADVDYRFYLSSLKEAAARFGGRVHAYVLMTNHVHLLLTPECPETPSRLLQSVGRHYVRYVNQAYQRSGTLWEGRYKSALIDAERYLLACCRYIELNPVRSGRVSSPADYRWSSFRSNGVGMADPLLTLHPLYAALGDSTAARVAAYRATFDSTLDAQDIQAIRDATERGCVLGNDRFKDQIKTILQRRIERQPHGGDRKSGVYRKRGWSEIN